MVTQLVAMVVYGRLPSPKALRLLLRCPRCEGSTYDRTDSRRRCPLCTSTPGRHVTGWAYLVPTDLDPPEPGDIVEVPATPYTAGRPARGTVVELREHHAGDLARKYLLRVSERRGWATTKNDIDQEGGEDVRKWELSSVDPETDHGTVRGNRAAAVAAATAKTEETGRKVYVQPAGSTVTHPEGDRR